MAGEIHGIISNEQAWNMWRPYGDRVELDSNVNVSIMKILAVRQ